MWKYESYMQKGIAHIQSAVNCQDSVLINENKQCIVSALADGLGSLKYSEIAAQIVTQTVCDILLQAPLSEILFESIENDEKLKNVLTKSIKENLAVKAEEMGISLHDMDSTLAFVYISIPYNIAIIGSLGDSAVCVIKSVDSIVICDSDVSANATNAILDKDSNERIELFRYNLDTDDIYGFIIASDGLENELYLKGSRYVTKAAEKYFNAVSVGTNPKNMIVSAIHELTNDEESPFDDDISIAVLSRINKPITLAYDPTWLCTCGERNRMQDTYCHRCNKDFVILYNKFNFIEYGGKAVFFSKINGDPKKERELLGLPGEKETQGKKSEVSDMSTQNGKDNNQKSKNKWLNIVAVAVIFVFGIVVGSFFTKLFVSKSIIELSSKVDGLVATVETQNNELSVKVDNLVETAGTQNNDLSARVDILSETTDTQNNELNNVINNLIVALKTPNKESTGIISIILPVSYTMLANGACYWGYTEEGIPDGNGILLEDGEYYIGTFGDGLKNGVFYVFAQEDPSNVRKILYSDDKEGVSSVTDTTASSLEFSGNVEPDD